MTTCLCHSRVNIDVALVQTHLCERDGKFYARATETRRERYVRHLDMTVLSVHIKTKLCQVVEAMMRRRDDLAFRQIPVSREYLTSFPTPQEMKFRNKMVEYVTDWVLGTSHQIAPPLRADASSISRELDQACIRRSPAAEGTAAAAEESDRGDLMEAKSQLFLKTSASLFRRHRIGKRSVGRPMKRTDDLGRGFTVDASKPKQLRVYRRRPTAETPDDDLALISRSRYFTLFMNLLNDCNEVEMAEGPGRLETLRNATIQACPICSALI
ncbi:hypothetical protein MSG28_015358 [Choristoneura fumiferana]|uniref:Uncharacterized protein n=1 Tax=Choristoneura fumiferana TaxID=7141 RepID=A0ACC0KAS5_CHOFU|nr:hypothetical protein MSG28_015358 [Choristoneura fumiferana]